MTTNSVVLLCSAADADRVNAEVALLLGDRRHVGQDAEVGRLHQHDRRAVVARFLEQLLAILWRKYW